jgi:hypothetical protein
MVYFLSISAFNMQFVRDALDCPLLRSLRIRSVASKVSRNEEGILGSGSVGATDGVVVMLAVILISFCWINDDRQL